jgi:hypothetical protein
VEHTKSLEKQIMAMDAEIEAKIREAGLRFR